MKYEEIQKTENLFYLNVRILSKLFPDNSVQNIKNRLHHLEKTGKIVRLRRDFYILNSQFEAYKAKDDYFAVIACLLKSPSYLSLEYVLRKYDVLSEATYGYTLVTTKSRSSVVNKLGTFHYYSIKKPLFIGYKIFYFGEYEYYEATKAKALFDWIYFRINTIPFEKPDLNLVEELRLNLESFTKKDFIELKKYSSLTGKKNVFKTIINNIIKNAPNYN